MPYGEKKERFRGTALTEGSSLPLPEGGVRSGRAGAGGADRDDHPQRQAGNLPHPSQGRPDPSGGGGLRHHLFPPGGLRELPHPGERQGDLPGPRGLGGGRGHGLSTLLETPAHPEDGRAEPEDGGGPGEGRFRGLPPQQPPLPRRLPDTGEEPAPAQPCGEPQEETLRLPQAAGLAQGLGERLCQGALLPGRSPGGGEVRRGCPPPPAGPLGFPLPGGQHPPLLRLPLERPALRGLGEPLFFQTYERFLTLPILEKVAVKSLREWRM